MKECNRCHTIKSLDLFSAHPNGIGRKHPTCAECRNKHYRQYYKDHKKEILKRQKENPQWSVQDKYRKYGITKEKFEQVVVEQNNRCKICLKEAKLVIDHCHINNKFRGLLCSNCNIALGHFKDNKENLKLAIKYLEDWESQA